MTVASSPQRTTALRELGYNPGRPATETLQSLRAMPKRRKRPAPYSPRVWGSWFLIACAWLSARLPLGVLLSLGSLIGRLGYVLARSRRHITRVNLRLCFPELDPPARQRLAREVFRHTGVGLAETLIVWLAPGREIDRYFTIEGIQHLTAASALGRGVLLVGAHFSCIDIASQTVSRRAALDVMYRRNRNPAWEWLQVHGRQHYFDAVIERDDTRQALRRLKEGHTLWYAADQDYGAKHSVFAPFFGVPAATITATARLARFNHSPVLFLSVHRDLARRRWTVEIGPPLDGFPSGDDRTDATLINALVEEAVRRHPEQYLWLHRRFKTRPSGEKRPY
jgi:KDO2-lipid IV(A) lauroyltransferase